MGSKTEPDRFTATGFPIADTPTARREHLFHKMREKTATERLIIGCKMADATSRLGSPNLSESLHHHERPRIFISRFCPTESLKASMALDECHFPH